MRGQNWSCDPPSPDQIRSECSEADSAKLRGNCAFHIRADSVIAEPDEVRIGWASLSDINAAESSTSSVAFVASFANDSTSFAKLCSPQLSPGVVTPSRPYYERYFATLDVPAQNCSPPPPPAPPPPLLTCACSDDSDCFQGDTCAEINGVKQCRGVCLTDADCSARGLLKCFNVSGQVPGITFGACGL